MQFRAYTRIRHTLLEYASFERGSLSHVIYAYLTFLRLHGACTTATIIHAVYIHAQHSPRTRKNMPGVSFDDDDGDDDGDGGNLSKTTCVSFRSRFVCATIHRGAMFIKREREGRIITE